MKTWIFAHPYWSALIGIGILAGAGLLIWWLTKDDDTEPVAEPNPSPERAGSIIIYPRFNMAPSGMGSGNVGGAGLAGGRFGHAKT